MEFVDYAEKKLTFEHVPPETVFNKGAVRNIGLDVVIKDILKENKLLWEIPVSVHRSGSSDCGHLFYNLFLQNQGMPWPP